LIRVGGGELAPEAMADILAARDRSAAGPTAPAHGLTLMEIKFA
jgi:tRNA pseudouridine38-40 synthase